jgi:hypothetical protein
MILHVVNYKVGNRFIYLDNEQGEHYTTEKRLKKYLLLRKQIPSKLIIYNSIEEMEQRTNTLI